MLDTQGNVLGEHKGIHYYTIGQRKGLGISSRKALYVTSIDPKRNAVVVGTEHDVYGDELICSDMNWIGIDDLKHPAEVKAKIRYNHKEAKAKVSPLDLERTHVKFKEPQMAITPGQAVVFYSGDLVIGSGTIEIEER
jgi:tRNA-specific 2-thiouridylase